MHNMVIPAAAVQRWPLSMTVNQFRLGKSPLVAIM
jgi:hypothetical protein